MKIYVYVLFVYTRDHRGDESIKNAIKLASLELDDLKKQFKSYLIDHRADDDYLEDETFSNIMLDTVNDIQNSPAPELNSAYTTEYFELEIPVIPLFKSKIQSS